MPPPPSPPPPSPPPPPPSPRWPPPASPRPPPSPPPFPPPLPPPPLEDCSRVCLYVSYGFRRASLPLLLHAAPSPQQAAAEAFFHYDFDDTVDYFVANASRPDDNAIRNGHHGATPHMLEPAPGGAVPTLRRTTAPFFHPSQSIVGTDALSHGGDPLSASAHVISPLKRYVWRDSVTTLGTWTPDESKGGAAFCAEGWWPLYLSKARAAAASPTATAVAMTDSPFFLAGGVAGQQTGGHTGRLPCPGGREAAWAAAHLRRYREQLQLLGSMGGGGGGGGASAMTGGCAGGGADCATGGGCSDAPSFGAPYALRAYTDAKFPSVDVSSDSCADVLQALAQLYSTDVPRVCYQVSPSQLSLAFASIGSFLGLNASTTNWTRGPAGLTNLASLCRETCGFCTEAVHGVAIAATPMRETAAAIGSAVDGGGGQWGYARCEWLSQCDGAGRGNGTDVAGSPCSGHTVHSIPEDGYCYESSSGSLECGRLETLLDRDGTSRVDRMRSPLGVQRCARGTPLARPGKADGVRLLVGGCMNELDPSYDAVAEVHVPQLCSEPVDHEQRGCMVRAALDYAAAAVQPAPCRFHLRGCNDTAALNYNAEASEPDGGSCVYPVRGCTLPTEGYADVDPATPGYESRYVGVPAPGVGVVAWPSYGQVIAHDAAANTLQGCVLAVEGCMDPAAYNYDADATLDSRLAAAQHAAQHELQGGSGGESAPPASPSVGWCVADVEGCMMPNMSWSEDYDASPPSPLSLNFDGAATRHNASLCVVAHRGCMSPSALNYDRHATLAGRCYERKRGCLDRAALNYNCSNLGYVACTEEEPRVSLHDETACWYELAPPPNPPPPRSSPRVVGEEPRYTLAVELVSTRTVDEWADDAELAAFTASAAALFGLVVAADGDAGAASASATELCDAGGFFCVRTEVMAPPPPPPLSYGRRLDDGFGMGELLGQRRQGERQGESEGEGASREEASRVEERQRRALQSGAAASEAGSTVRSSGAGMTDAQLAAAYGAWGEQAGSAYTATLYFAIDVLETPQFSEAVSYVAPPPPPPEPADLTLIIAAVTGGVGALLLCCLCFVMRHRLIDMCEDLREDLSERKRERGGGGGASTALAAVHPPTLSPARVGPYSGVSPPTSPPTSSRAGSPVAARPSQRNAVHPTTTARSVEPGGPPRRAWEDVVSGS